NPIKKTTDASGVCSFQGVRIDSAKSYAIKAEITGYGSEEKSLPQTDLTSGTINVDFRLSKLIVGENQNVNQNRNESANTNTSTGGTTSANKGGTTHIDDSGGTSFRESVKEYWLPIIVFFVILGGLAWMWIAGWRVEFYNVSHAPSRPQ